jgi:hypothetical protein
VVDTVTEPPPSGVVSEPLPPPAKGKGRAGAAGDEKHWVPDGREGSAGTPGVAPPLTPAPAAAPKAIANSPAEPAANRMHLVVRIILSPYQLGRHESTTFVQGELLNGFDHVELPKRAHDKGRCQQRCKDFRGFSV